MNILHVYKDYFPVLGGIENHIRWLAEGMQARGHQVRALVTDPTPRGGEAVIHGVPVTRVGRQFNVSSAPIGVGMFPALRRLGRDAEIVHLHAPYPPGELAQLLLAAGRRTVITYHSDIVKQAGLLRVYAPFLRAILRRADAVLVASPPYVQTSPFLAPVHQAFPGKVRVVHFGIDLARFAPTPATLERAAQLKARYGPGPLILFVGRLRYYKGVSVLVQAMAQVTAQIPGARALIVGSGPMEGEIRQVMAQMGVTDSVILAGSLPDADLPAIYRAADLFVLPSIHRSEALGIVQLEAMASGLPLVSTELGTGTSYVNRHGETGLVVPPQDPPALAAAIVQILGDGALSARFRAASQRRAAREFSLAHMLDSTEQVYRELLA